MSTLYTIYDATTGEVLRENETSTTGAEAAATVTANTFAGEAAHAGEALDGREWWFDSDVKTSRPGADFSPLSSAVLEGDIRTITGLPVGAVAAVQRPEGGDLTATIDSSGELAITFSDVGAYLLRIASDFPFKTSEIEIDVQPAS